MGIRIKRSHRLPYFLRSPLLYFAFWFNAAPVLTLLVLANGPSWVLFLIFLFGLLIAFVYHTFLMLLGGFNASDAPDEPTTKTAFISATPQSHSGEERIACPMCSEKILPQAKICYYCKSVFVLNPPGENQL